MTVLSKIISPRLTKALKPLKVCLINDCKNVSDSLSHKKLCDSGTPLPKFSGF